MFYGSKALASLIAAQGAKDAAEDGAGDAADSGGFMLFRAVAKWFRVAERDAPVAPVASSAPSTAVDIGTQFDQSWNAHWDAVAAALKAPVDED